MKSVFMILNLIIILSLIQTIFCDLKSNKVPCRLQWHPITEGGGGKTEIPLSAISLSIGVSRTDRCDVYILRKVIHGTIVHGRGDICDHNLGVKSTEFVHKGIRYLNEVIYDVLDNPDNCTIKWLSLNERKLNFKLATKVGNELVAIYNNVPPTCDLKNDNNCTTTGTPSPCLLQLVPKFRCDPIPKGSTNNAESISLSSIYILNSYTTGKINVMIDQIISVNEVDTGFQIDFMGYDKVVNKGYAETTELVEHSLEVSRFFSSDIGIYLDAGIYGMLEIEFHLDVAGARTVLFSIVIHLGFQIYIALFLKHEIEEKVTMTMAQSVKVPAETSVEVCSLAVLRQFNLTVVSSGLVSIPGLESDEVINILEYDTRFSPPYTRVDERTVRANFIREVKASEPWTSNIFVLPLNSLGTTCVGMRKEIELLRAESNGPRPKVQSSFETEKQVKKFLSKWSNNS